MKYLLPLVFLVLTACEDTTVFGPGPFYARSYPATVVLATPVRPHIHAIVVLPGDRLLVRYIPGTVTELQIVASLQSHCASVGKTAFRAPGPTARETVRNRRGQSRIVSVFTVECR